MFNVPFNEVSTYCNVSLLIGSSSKSAGRFMNKTDKQITLIINYLNNPRTNSMSHNFTFLPKECRIRSLDLSNKQEWQLK